VQNTDWEEVREGLEEGASRLWTKAFGETPEEVAVDAKEQAEAAAIKAKGAASGVAASARDAYSKAKASGISAEQAAENKVLEARLWTKKETVKAGDAAKGKAEEAKGLLATAWETGKDKAKNLAGLAKGAADAAESATNETLAPALSPVQRALQQRYQRPEAKVNKTVAEVLKERYTPLDQRDNTVLRGV
jgi:altered-inheritance-of-mitochondria protein 5